MYIYLDVKLEKKTSIQGNCTVCIAMAAYTIHV